jgi:hypothetical protein
MRTDWDTITENLGKEGSMEIFYYSNYIGVKICQNFENVLTKMMHFSVDTKPQ